MIEKKQNKQEDKEDYYFEKYSFRVVVLISIFILYMKEMQWVGDSIQIVLMFLVLNFFLIKSVLQLVGFFRK